ncbi:MAG: hypothetical protein ABIF11_04505 [Nitrospirota bacterium]
MKRCEIFLERELFGYVDCLKYTMFNHGVYHAPLMVIDTLCYHQEEKISWDVYQNPCQ